MTEKCDNLSIIVVGASGDLARKKIFPALFALYCQDYLPKDFNIFGFARTKFTHEEFRAKITEHLTCRYVPGESCSDKMDEFLSHCYYSAGDYKSRDSFVDLYSIMHGIEKSSDTNRMFYLAIPPSIFLDVARALGGAGLVNCGQEHPWSRVVIEKPFGRDRASSDVLTKEMLKIFKETETFRIDHYLGKEAVQNLMVLRFANQVLEPLWNNQYIEKICIDWKEDIGLEGRAGYFDNYGIIRDVIQNHLLQILALIAMDRPIDSEAKSIQTEKVKVLKNIDPIELKNLFIGQYKAYKDEKDVPTDSITPTYAAAVLRIKNPRWDGVPFIISAGKGLNDRTSEVRIHFKKMDKDIFPGKLDKDAHNQIIIRIQPDEAIHLKIANKTPGLEFALKESDLNLQYESAFETEIPEAYECLLLDVIKGDKSQFIHSTELRAAWDIFTPALHELEDKKIKPKIYPFGSDRPHTLEDIL